MLVHARECGNQIWHCFTMTWWNKELEEEAFGLYVYHTSAFSVVCKLLSPVSSLLEEMASPCSWRLLQSPTIPHQCPARPKPVLCLFLHGALLRALKGALLPGCAGAVHSVCSLPSVCTLHFLWVAVNALTGMGTVQDTAVLKQIS